MVDGSKALERLTNKVLQKVATPHFGDFYRSLYPKVYRFVYARTDAPPSDVEDLVQETLLNAWEGRRDFAGEAEPETWVLSIARHKVADHGRRRERDRRHGAEAVCEALARIDQDSVPEDLLETAEMRRRVAEALDALDEDYARVLTLRYLEGMSVRAVAEALGETPTAVESRLSRAREAFRKRLGGACD